MEGAVRSGHLAAEVILNQVFPGEANRVLVADLARGPLARRMIRDG